jgi:hypothetical protein
MALYAVRFFRPAAYWIQAEMQRYRDTEIQRYRDTEIQRYRDTGTLQGAPASPTHSALISVYDQHTQYAVFLETQMPASLQF